MYQKTLKYIALSGLFLVPFVPLIIAEGHFFPSLLFPFITGKNFAFRIIVEIVFAAWLALVVAHPQYRPKGSLILWALLAFLGIIAVADIFSVNPSKSIWSNFERMEGLVTHVHLLAYFLVAATMFQTQKLWSWFLHTNIGVGIFMVLYCALQLGGELVINQGGVRVDGTFGNASYLGVYFLFLIFFALLFAVKRNAGELRNIVASGMLGSILFLINQFFSYFARLSDLQAKYAGVVPPGVKENFFFGPLDTWLFILSLVAIIILAFVWYKSKKWGDGAKNKVALSFYLLTMALFSIPLYYSATRGAILGSIFGLTIIFVLLALFEKKNKILRGISIAVIAGIIILSAVFVSEKDSEFVKNNVTLSRFSSLFNSDIKTFFTSGEGKSRYLIGKAALEGAEARPILGWGEESFNYLFYAHYDPAMYNQEAWFDRAHNVIFDWLTAGGILGLLAYLFIFVVAFYYLWKDRRGDSPRMPFSERVIIAGLLIAYFLENLTVFDNIVSYIFFFTVLAFLHYTYGGTRVLPVANAVKSNKKINKVQKDETDIVAPILIAIALLFSLYFVNMRGIQTARNLISAISPQEQGFQKNLEYFKRALSYGFLGKSEVREFLAQSAEQVSASDADQKVKDAFYTLAKTELDQQLKETPLDVRYYFFAGTMALRIEGANAGIPYLEKAVELSPKKQPILLELGQAYANAGKIPEAVKLFQKAYELDTTYDDARVIYALGLIYSKDNAGAQKLLGTRWDSLLLSDARFPSAFSVSGQYPQAIALWKKWIEKDPKNFQAHLSLALSYIKINDRTNAVLELQKAISLDATFKERGEDLIGAIKAGKKIE
ncbi:MAG: O-antigen ligase family protein [Candidatus Taylorbacteria bacterium]